VAVGQSLPLVALYFNRESGFLFLCWAFEDILRPSRLSQTEHLKIGQELAKHILRFL